MSGSLSTVQCVAKIVVYQEAAEVRQSCSFGTDGDTLKFREPPCRHYLDKVSNTIY